MVSIKSDLYVVMKLFGVFFGIVMWLFFINYVVLGVFVVSDCDGCVCLIVVKV